MTISEDLNYERDARVIAGRRGDWWETLDPKRMTATVEIPPTDVDEGELLEVAWEYEVCPLCGGKGTHVNPSIDSCGLSAEDFAEDPDFAEQYFNGAYDQTCNQCHGQRVVPVTHDPRAVAHFEEEAQYAAQSRAEYEAERRMGA